MGIDVKISSSHVRSYRELSASNQCVMVETSVGYLRRCCSWFGGRGRLLTLVCCLGGLPTMSIPPESYAPKRSAPERANALRTEIGPCEYPLALYEEWPSRMTPTARTCKSDTHHTNLPYHIVRRERYIPCKLHAGPDRQTFDCSTDQTHGHIIYRLNM